MIWLNVRAVPQHATPISLLSSEATGLSRNALRGVARLQGQEPATIEGDLGSFADLKAWIAKADAILQGVTPEVLAGAEERKITFPVGDRTETLSGAGAAASAPAKTETPDITITLRHPRA